MPVKKNSEARHRILDRLLGDKYHQYSMKDLNRLCNEESVDLGYSEVDLRTTQNDIKYLMGPNFNAPIVYYNVGELNAETGKTFTKQCLHYEDPDFSIYQESLSADDKKTLREALTMFSQFSGLPNQSALNFLRVGFRAQSKDPIVGFSKSPMGDSSIFAELFKAISNRIVVELHYHVFSAINEIRTVVFHPYYLREYNRRWYIFGAADDTGKLLQFGLDRIDKVEYLSTYIYKRCKYDIERILEKVVGVTVYEDKEPVDITFWVSDSSKEYVNTKKIHWSQCQVEDMREYQLYSENPSLVGGAFFTMRCQDNYELIRELCSFGSDLVVLSPTTIQEKIISRQEKILERYQSLRK